MYLVINPKVQANAARVDENFVAVKNVPFKVTKKDSDMLLERNWKGSIPLFVETEAPKPKPKPPVVEVNQDGDEE